MGSTDGVAAKASRACIQIRRRWHFATGHTPSAVRKCHAALDPCLGRSFDFKRQSPLAAGWLECEWALKAPVRALCRLCRRRVTIWAEPCSGEICIAHEQRANLHDTSHSTAQILLDSRPSDRVALNLVSQASVVHGSTTAVALLRIRRASRRHAVEIAFRNCSDA